MENNQPNRQRRRKSPVPMQVVQNSLARCMSQIIVNMFNRDIQESCKELLQVEHLEQVHPRILQILKHIDVTRQEKRQQRTPRRERRRN